MKTEPIKLTFKSGYLWHGEYQVVNPEAIPFIVRSFDKIIRKDGRTYHHFNDGDQITLPEGYTLHIGRDQAGKATIDPPEKPENSAHTHQDYAGDRIPLITTVEPSESQEEMWKEVVDKISKTVESYVNEFIDSSSEQMRDDLRADLEELNGKFTITRK